MMLKKFVLLISILVAFSATAQDANITISGYGFSTYFSDKNFHDNRNVIAVNFDADAGNFAFRSQVTGLDATNTVRRAVIEYAYPVYGYEVIGQVGRFGRIDSFYSGVLDSPGNYQMAILPFSGYSYRMYNGSFTLMDGVNLIVKRKVNDTLFTLRGAYGSGVVDQESLQKEAFRKYDPNIRMESTRNNYDLSLKFELHNWSGYISKNYYQSDIDTRSNYILYKMFTDKYHTTEYNLYKTGIQYDNNLYFIRTELTSGKTYVFDSRNIETGTVKAFDYNIVGGLYINNHKIYSGLSHGHNYTANVDNEDYFIGTTLNYKSLATSIEYHKGYGFGWMKYVVDRNNARWNSLIISTTYSF